MDSIHIGVSELQRATLVEVDLREETASLGELFAIDISAQPEFHFCFTKMQLTGKIESMINSLIKIGNSNLIECCVAKVLLNCFYFIFI